jgi:hypothetical protein
LVEPTQEVAIKCGGVGTLSGDFKWMTHRGRTEPTETWESLRTPNGLCSRGLGKSQGAGTGMIDDKGAKELIKKKRTNSEFRGKRQFTDLVIVYPRALNFNYTFLFPYIWHILQASKYLIWSSDVRSKPISTWYSTLQPSLA